MTKTKTAALFAAITLGAGIIAPVAASAGEITGNGKDTGAYTKSNSECAFSGLEDNDREAPVVPGVTQNWGQIPKAERVFLTGIGVSPGALCNGHLSPRK